jgi:hypothetical protein
MGGTMAEAIKQKIGGKDAISREEGVAKYALN